ncbi:hypothetical protein [Piscinibacter sp. XHJ-5]|uniref:hypothetical protein n=1 Tax=Piscinibacter sp. XHJ-5 TaxID=3037797 RepID=UPI0024530AB0|nr:hypothetical protein [Piscinibacter sp. XHJ-5]
MHAKDHFLRDIEYAHGASCSSEDGLLRRRQTTRAAKRVDCAPSDQKKQARTDVVGPGLHVQISMIEE